jgi:hypothetical protein
LDLSGSDILSKVAGLVELASVYGCSDGMIREDRPDDWYSVSPRQFSYHRQHCINSELEKTSDELVIWDDYTEKVQAYTRRNLTHEFDILATFTGILERYRFMGR